jgi:uncharacterized membrane protein YphA (DoxX/SURF4 family)
MNPLAYVVLAFRLLIGITLAVAGGLKVGHEPALASAMAGFRLLPADLIAFLAVALPYVEILLGLYLIVGLFTRTVAWICVAQFVIYAGAIASAVLRGIPANCGCFGPGDAATADWPHVGFDLVLALICLVIALRAPGALAVDRKLTAR